MKEQRSANKRLAQENEKLTVRLEQLLEEQKQDHEHIAELATHAGDAQRSAEDAGAQIMALKAKLYDYMTAGAWTSHQHSLSYRAYGRKELAHMDNEHRSTDHLDCEVCELFRELDKVQQKAVLTIAATMIPGLEDIAALEAGNIILATAGYPPAVAYIPENDYTGGMQ